ncbi:MAG: N-6 DNA methylase [Methylococcales bacterium]|nr:N-6 DNA methylase [Methylococcales bacterium]
MNILTERDVETQIDEQLRNKKWVDDIRHPERNVYKHSVKTSEQKQALDRKIPDYVLYQQCTDQALIVIEAKKPHKNLSDAIEQAVGYAQAIQAPMVFATDGIFTKTLHLPTNQPLLLNGEEIDELIDYSLAIEYLRSNEYNTLDKKVIKSRDELIAIFDSLNDSFRDAGVRNGVERTELFCNILFLKVISEMSEIENALTNPVQAEYLWKNFRQKKGSELMEFINKIALGYFKQTYGGEVLSEIKLFKPEILDVVVQKLDDLSLANTNIDIKGDAFEYFLRNYGGADTDFGEYFTPRHIVKTVVKLLNPQIGEKVYDPFCGTGGMLITAFKHIYDRMARNEDNIRKLKEQTVYGGEISSMFRVAKMNMILTGDGHSNIKQQDSYGSPQKGQYDVVITNIPFGKKAKTKHAGLYSYDTSSAEVTGVLHCIDALSDAENARAGIIVPYGILFTKNKAYSDLRKKLVDQCELQSIVELHKYTFAPRTNVNARILIVKKRKNPTQKIIWYFPVRNDGFMKSAKRRRVLGNNDLDTLLAETNLTIENKERLQQLNFTALSISEVRKSDYSLVVAEYVTNVENFKSCFPLIKLGEVINYETGKRPRGGISGIAQGAISLGGTHIHEEGYIDLTKIAYVPMDYYLDCNRGRVAKDDILLCKDGAKTGKVAIVRNEFLEKPVMANEHVYIIRGKQEIIDQKYLFYCLHSDVMFNKIQELSQKTAQEGLTQHILENLRIPLPSLDEQQAVIAQIDNKQKAIANARQLIKNLEREISDELSGVVGGVGGAQNTKMKLGDLITLEYGRAMPQHKREQGTFPVIGSNGIIGYHSKYFVKAPCIVIGRKGSAGEINWIDQNCFPIDTTFFVNIKMMLKQ